MPTTNTEAQETDLALDTELSTPELPAIDLTKVMQKTIFLSVRFGSVGNTKKVPGANVLTTDADMSLLRVSKTLLESVQLDAIRHHDSDLRKWLSNACLPYDIGVLLLPTGLIPQTRNKLRQHEEERNVLIDAFVSVYPQIKANAQANLKDLYNESDYPSLTELRERFKFTYKMFTFTVPEQLQVVDPAFFEAEQEKQSLQIREAAQDIILIMRQRLLELVEHLQERLTPDAGGAKKVLRESAVNNLQEFLDNFDDRNVVGDEALQREVQKVRSLLGGTTAKALRTSEEWKEKIRVGMDNVASSLGGLVEVQGRVFKNI